MIKINAAAVTAGLTLIETALPQVFAAEQLIRAIWATANPAKTEADYLAYLDGQSDKLIVDSDGILASLGYVRGADGKWSKA